MTIIVWATRHLYRTWRRVINGVDYSRSRKLKDESYIKSYYNIKGELKNRKLSKQIRVKIFAVIKYVFDRTMATLGLIIASPIMVVIAIIVKLESKGPIFFKQEKIKASIDTAFLKGSDGEKFRAMVEGDPDRKLLKDRILYLKQLKIGDIKIADADYLKSKYLGDRKIILTTHGGLGSLWA